jgi:hypothetical protein
MAAPIPALERPFAEIRSRLRLRRTVRGTVVAMLLIVSLAAAGCAMDVVFELPRLMRCMLFILWLYYSTLIVRRHILNPWRATLPEPEIAKTIEERYPAFSERLITLTSEPTGSRHLIAQLGRESERRSRAIQSAVAAPGTSLVRDGLIAVILLIAVTTAIALLPGGAERTRRFVIPWYEPGRARDFQVVVTSGEPVVRRGDAVSLTAYLERLKANAVYPPTIDLLVREGDKETMIPMTGDDRGVYVFTKPNVRSEFQYRVRLRNESGDWLTVRVGDAVDLTDDSSMTIQPPPYANGAARTINGFGEFDALQYSTVHLCFALNRTAEAIALEFATPDGNSQTIPVTANGLTASAAHLIKQSGMFKLTLTGEHGLKSTLVAPVKALPDMPPAFVTVAGLSNRTLEIRPGERLPLAIGVADDLAVSSIRLEYRTAGSNASPQQIAIPLEGLGTPHAMGRWAFDTTGKCKTGETLQIRLCAVDGRSLPDLKLGPQETTFPPNDWLTLRITNSARPLAEQNIFGQRDAIADRLKAAVAKVNEAKAEVQAVAEGPKGRTGLSDDQYVRLKNAREGAAKAVESLQDAARDASLIPELTPIADQAKAIADGPVRQGSDATKRAESLSESAPRAAEFDHAYRQFADAIRRIEETLARNDALARSRLDKRILDDLAAEERELAAAAAKAQPGPESAALAAKQRELRERLAAAIRESEGLRSAYDAQAKKRAAELAAEAEKLKSQFEQNEKERQVAEKTALTARNQALAESQKQLAREADQLANAAKAGSQAGNVTPPKTGSASTAAQKFADGDPLAAMAEQESAARELDRTAEAFEQAANARRDPKVLAKQVARWQQDFATRYAATTKTQSAGELPAHVRERMQAEQEAIRKAVEAIRVPSKFANRKAEAKTKADDVSHLLAKSAPAGVALREAARATEALAEQLPSREERLKFSRGEINKLIDEQANIARDNQDATKAPADTAAKKRAELAERQKQLAGTTASLDLPGLESRKEKAAAIVQDAADDLKDGRSQDAQASLAESRRQLERLKQAVEGIEPADTLVDRLAQKQREIANAAERLKPDSPAPEFDRLGELERELNRELSGLSSPESSGLANAAKDAAREAELATRRPMNQKPDVDELKKKTKAAADAMDRLADRMNVAESDANRVERLIRNRERAAEQAKQLAGKPVNPDAHADAQRKAQSDIDELTNTRVGKAEKEKAQALAALQKLAQTPDPDRRAELQKQAAESLVALQQAIKGEWERAQAYRRSAPDGKPDFDAKSAPGLPTADIAQAARELAAKQRAMRDQAAREAANGASRGAAGEALRKKDADLAKLIRSLAEQVKAEADVAGMSRTDEAHRIGNAMQKAGDTAKQASDQAHRANRESAAGRPDTAKQARGEARSNLQATADALAQVAKPGETTPARSPSGDAGKAAAEMANAEKQLAANNAQAAGKAMNAAADALNPPSEKNGPPGNGPPGEPQKKSDSAATATFLPPDLKQYAGVPWGDLPGDVKSKIVQDLRAKYGDEYARIIKLYFEQLADSK